jgi:hypothetical protein
MLQIPLDEGYPLVAHYSVMILFREDDVTEKQGTKKAKD